MSKALDTDTTNVRKDTVTAARKKRKKPVEDGAFVDMVAFASLMTILLAFFIMLSSNVGPIKNEVAKEAIDSFKEALDNFGVSKIAFGSSDSITNLEIKLENYGGKYKKDKKLIKNVFANTIDDKIDINSFAAATCSGVGIYYLTGQGIPVSLSKFFIALSNLALSR